MEKIAIYCETKEEWSKVTKASGKTWGVGKLEPISKQCLNVSEFEDLKYSSQEFYLANGYTIISAADYLKEGEVEEFKVGDRVECIDSGNYGHLRIGGSYSVTETYKSGKDLLIRVAIGSPGVYAYRFKLARSTTNPKVIKESDANYLEENNEAVCVMCRAYFEDMPSHCEGSRCEEAGELYLEENPNEEEDNMKDNNTDSNVLAVFGSKVNGDELVVIDRHFTDNMLKEILMEKHYKAIQAACKEAEDNRLEAEKK